MDRESCPLMEDLPPPPAGQAHSSCYLQPQVAPSDGVTPEALLREDMPLICGHAAVFG